MKKISIFLILMLSFSAFSQNTDPSADYRNAAAKMTEDHDKLTIGGYAQIDFNQPIQDGSVQNGTLDVHRLVLLFGYKFNQKIQFITEIELEHVSEIYIEQAFLEYKMKDWLKFRGGLLLVPMGIINEYHEPPTFNGVERPSLDTYIIPTTWREIGAGITGVIREVNIKYQLYCINGFLSYNEKATFNGKNGLRNGRQKGVESVIRFPNFAGKVEFYGIKGLNLGLSGYAGKSQSTLYNDIPSEGPEVQTADSSVVGIAIAGADARYSIKGMEFRAQFNFGKFSNSEEYNAFTGSDFGSSVTGFYLEAGYNIFATSAEIKSRLTPFIRYENYDTQHTVAGSLEKNPAWHRNEFTFGIGWKPVDGVAVKADYQVFNNESGANSSSRLNFGIGVWF
jgi:hypothetical protein